MKIKTLMILILVAAVFVVLAIVSNRRETRQTPAVLGRKAIPDLPINDVTAIAITTADATLRVARTQDRWTVQDKYHYPADFGKISRLLLTLADLKIGQVTRLSQAMTLELGLVPPTPRVPGQTNNLATQITLAGQGGKILATILLGKPHHRTPPPGESASMPMANYPDGRYITTDGKEAYLVTETFSPFTPLVRNWLEEKFVEIKPDDLHRIHIASAGATPITLVKADEKSEWSLEGLATNETLNTDRINQFTGVLGYLIYSDVADPALTPQQTGMDKPAVIELAARDGHRYTLRLGKTIPDLHARYLHVSVAFELPPAPPPETPVAGATNRIEKTKDLDMVRQAEAAKALNSRFSSWVFMVNEANADALIATRQDFIQKPGETPAGQAPLENPSGTMPRGVPPVHP